MTIFLVNQLKFARKEFQRCLEGLSGEDAVKRLLPMNCISWMVAHLANQENSYWNFAARRLTLHPGLRDLAGYGKPASTPPLADALAIWQDVTANADEYLDTLTLAQLHDHFVVDGKTVEPTIGTYLLRNTYHYWFHTGEAHAVRQQLGHTDLPQFVGDMEGYEYRMD
jgi:hypothetical protein